MCRVHKFNCWMNHSNHECFCSICIAHGACEMHKFLLENATRGRFPIGIKFNCATVCHVTRLCLNNASISKCITLCYRVSIQWACVCARFCQQTCCAWQIIFAMGKSLIPSSQTATTDIVEPLVNLLSQTKYLRCEQRSSRPSVSPGRWHRSANGKNSSARLSDCPTARVTNNNFVISWKEQLFYIYFWLLCRGEIFEIVKLKWNVRQLNCVKQIESSAIAKPKANGRQKKTWAIHDDDEANADQDDDDDDDLLTPTAAKCDR